MSADKDRKTLDPCPFCGAGTTQIHEAGKVWNGWELGSPSSVSVRHWCDPTPGQPSRMIERVGKDKASAIEAWNTRAPAIPPGWKPATEQAEAQTQALDAKDRDRYRWLRQECFSGRLTVALPGVFELRPWSGDDPDRLIDTAMAAGVQT